MKQNDLFDDTEKSSIENSIKDMQLGVTFKDSLSLGVYGWYPYVEGFSANYIQEILKKYKPKSVFDPFGGSGTTNLAASEIGIPSYYCEVNPFMVFVANTKINFSKWGVENKKVFSESVKYFINYINGSEFFKKSKNIDLSDYYKAFPDRGFFEEEYLRELILAKNVCLTDKNVAPEARNILLLACAANVVKSSNMTRRADLRRRRPDEYKNRIVDVKKFITETLERFLLDVNSININLFEAKFISNDARSIPDIYKNSFDLALTSPPYLNGTNYFRNTKLELWYCGFIDGEKELPKLNKSAITAGINNVSKKIIKEHVFEEVEKVACHLDEVSTDSRIPLLVRNYVSDMYDVFKSTFNVLKPGGRFILDIGDSKFYDVHVPTDEFLIVAASKAGFIFKESTVIARRHSRDKSALVQVELIFEKPHN